MIDTWNEVVSFLDGYSQSDDLATILSGMNSDIVNRVLIEDFEKLESSVAEIAGYFTNGSANNALKLGGQLPSYYATADALSTHISAFNTYKTTTDNRLNKLEALWYMDDAGNVHTTHNIVVEGGGAFGQGAEGGGSTGGLGSVTIKTEGGIEYKSDASGVVTVPNWITAGAIPTSLPASDVYSWAKAATKPSYAFSEITSKPTTLAGYGITDKVAYRETWNNFIHSSNEFTFAAPAFSGLLYINYRTASGNTDGAITEYRFAKGAGESCADIRAAKYIVNGGTSSQFLKADGSLDNTAYLPLSGGTLNNNKGIGFKAYMAISGGGGWAVDVLNLYDREMSKRFGGLGYYGDSLNLGYIYLGANAYNGNNLRIYADSIAFGEAPILTTANYANYALPKSGGTISGALTVTGNLYTPNIWFNAGDNGERILAPYSSLNYDLSYYDGSTWERVLTSKNYSNYALPLTGGTIESTILPLQINRLSGSISSIGYYLNSVQKGILGFDSSGNLVVSPNRETNSTYYNVIHSGNIGSQSVNYASSAARLSSTWNIDCNVASGDGVKIISNRSSSAGNYPSGYVSGLSVMSDYVGWQLVSYGGGMENPYFRSYQDNGTWKTWRQLAFLTDNVASATKLQDDTAFTAWGQTFFENGKPKNVDGNFTLYKNNSNSVVNWTRSIVVRNSSNTILGRFGFYGVGETLSYAFIGNSYSSPYISFLSTGNVLIGTTIDNGGKLQVNGSIYPSANKSYNIGTLSYQWKDLYLGGALRIFNSDNTADFLANWNETTLQMYAYEGVYYDIVIGTTLAAIATNKGLYYNATSKSWGIGTKTPGYTLDVNGNTGITGNLTVTGGGAFGSDIRYKDIITYQQLDLETIVKAPLFSFRWNDREDKATHLGTSAQYWLNTQAKDAVNITNPKFFHLDYGALAVGIGISVGREVKGVKTEVEQLRERVKQLETRLSKYEQVWHN